MKVLSIHLTDLCNSECNFCVVASPLYTKDSVVYQDVLSFLDHHRGDGYEAVNLHGGEPTIHPHFLDTLEYIHKLGYPEVHLQTNGIKLANRGFVEQLIAHGVRKFIISLHGDSPDVHDSQTHTKGGFSKTISGIRNVKELGAHVRTNTVITAQNLIHLTKIASLCCELGVDHLNFSNLHPVGSARFSRSRIMPAFGRIRESLYPALDVALERCRVVTLEGFPYCTIGEKYKHLHLTAEYREVKLLIRGQIISDYDTFMRNDMSAFGDQCQHCWAKSRCGGVYPEYVDYYGWSEFASTSAPALSTEVAAST
jgi:MoaA/NifB/PqqE/SkfB family radical SAM enzyme